MKAVSVRAPYGSLLVGVCPLYAWGAVPGVMDVLNMREGTDYRGDVLVHQSRTPDGAELRMKFAPEAHADFPLGAYLGVVRVASVLGPGERLDSPWAREGFWHWRVCWPRAFKAPLWRPGNVGLYEVDSFEVQEAVREAEHAARADWRALPEPVREELVERAALMEDGGLPPGEANRRSIDEYRTARARRAMAEQGIEGKGAQDYGKGKRRIEG